MIIDIPQNSPKWLEYRKSKIGASDVPVIMQESPYKTPLRLWREKMGFETPYCNEAMRRGTANEPIARELFNLTNSLDCKPITMVSDIDPWLMGSLDGYDEVNGVIVEIKNANDLDHELAKEKVVPTKYYGQLQCQMYVSGFPLCHYYSYQEGSQHVVIVHRDEDYISKMIPKCKKFYDQMMNFEEPEMSNGDYKDMSNNALWLEYEDRLNTLEQLITVYEIEKSGIREALIEMAKGQNCRSNLITLFKSARKGSIDYKRIPELQSVDLEAYRKPPSEVWTLRCE